MDKSLAICVCPADTLTDNELIDRMMHYTTVSMLPTKLDIFHAADIDSAMHGVAKSYDYVLLVAAGSNFTDLSIVNDIETLIQSESDFFAVADVFDWKNDWYELHHNLILVNSKAWFKAAKPDFGSWDPKFEEIPVVERSDNNYHSDNTPPWIRFTSEFKMQLHSKQGWNYICQAARNNFKIIVWDQTVKSKKEYFYPEVNSANLLSALKERKFLDQNILQQNKLIENILNMNGNVKYSKERL